MRPSTYATVKRDQRRPGHVGFAKPREVDTPKEALLRGEAEGSEGENASSKEQRGADPEDSLVRLRPSFLQTFTHEREGMNSPSKACVHV